MRAIMLVLLTCAASAAYNVVPQRANAHYTNIVRAAQREVSVADELPLTPSYVAFTLAFNLAAHVVGSNEAALAMSFPPVTLFTHGLEANLGALAWGIPGALAIAAIELWRCDGCSVEEEMSDECPRCSALTTPVLIGTAPLSVLSAIVLVDQGVGERAVDMVGSRSFDSAPRGLPSWHLEG